MYNEYDLAEAFELGYKQASNSYDEYDLAEAYEMGVKEASEHTETRREQILRNRADLNEDVLRMRRNAVGSGLSNMGLSRAPEDIRSGAAKLSDFSLPKYFDSDNPKLGLKGKIQSAALRQNLNPNAGKIRKAISSAILKLKR